MRRGARRSSTGPSSRLRIDDERPAQAVGRRPCKGANDRKHARRGLARPGLAQNQGVAGQELARYMAIRGIENMPLRDREARRPLDTELLGCSRTNPIDEPEGEGELGGDRRFAFEQAPVDSLDGVVVTIPAGTLHRTSDGASQVPALRPRLPLAGPEPRMEALEDLAVRALCLVRDLRGVGGTFERAGGEDPDHAVIEPTKERMQLRDRARGEVICVAGPGMVVDEPGAGLGDALVAERDHERARARCGGDDAGPEPNPLVAPVPDGVEIVGKSPRIAARGGDQELDLPIEVVVEDGLQGGDELVSRLPVERADEQDIRVVPGMHERDIGHVTSFAGCDRKSDGVWRHAEPGDVLYGGAVQVRG